MYKSVCNRPCLCCDKTVSQNVKLYVCVPMRYADDPEMEAIDMALDKRPIMSAGGSGGGDPWLDPEFARDYPSLFSFLNDTKYKGGEQRITGSCSFFTKAGTLTVALNDNDRGAVVFLTASTWAELIAMMDTAICDDSTDWKVRSTPRTGNRPPF